MRNAQGFSFGLYGVHTLNWMLFDPASDRDNAPRHRVRVAACRGYHDGHFGGQSLNPRP